jgi:hypothetical protein
MARRLSLSGFCIKDLYESLDASFCSRDLERACCLAVELACTPGEARNLLGFLIDTFAQWHACCNLWLLERLADLLECARDATGHRRSKPGPAWDAEARRALCEATLLIGSQKRRDRQSFLRKIHCPEPWFEKRPSNAPLMTRLTDSLLGGDARSAMAVASRVVAQGTGTDDSTPDTIKGDPSIGFRNLAPALRSDPVWHVFAAALAAAVSMGKQQHAAVHALLRLYAMRCSKRQRDTRINLLYGAIHVAMQADVKHAPPDEAQAAVLQRGRACIDDVFDEVLSNAPTPATTSAAPAAAPAAHGAMDGRRSRARQSRDDAVEGKMGTFLRCLTPYNNAARCELADEIRDAHMQRSAHRDTYVKHIRVHQR